MDTDENLCFMIADVVEKDDILYFQYHKVVEDGSNAKKRRRDEDSFEYTPCEEILTAGWVDWTEMSL